jgi:hypothetical protein
MCKVAPVHAIKLYWGAEVQLYIFLISALDVSGKPHSPVDSYPGKNHGTHWKWRLGGPQSRYWCFGEEKNVLPLQGFEPGSSSLKCSHYTRLYRLPQGAPCHLNSHCLVYLFIYLLIIDYLKKLSLTKSTQRRMREYLMNNEMERALKQDVV